MNERSKQKSRSTKGHDDSERKSSSRRREAPAPKADDFGFGIDEENSEDFFDHKAYDEQEDSVDGLVESDTVSDEEREFDRPSEEEVAEDEGRSRPRRRRRRRGRGRSRRSADVEEDAADSEEAPASGIEDEVVDDDFGAFDDEDDESAEEESEPRGRRRRPRRRRRRRSRSETEQLRDNDDASDVDADDESEFDDFVDEEDESEALSAERWGDVPTWEEAITSMLKVASDTGRGGQRRSGGGRSGQSRSGSSRSDDGGRGRGRGRGRRRSGGRDEDR